MELCTCLKFRQYTITDGKGHTRQGCFVHQTTQARNWAKFSQDEADRITERLPKLSLQKIPQKIIPSAEKVKNKMLDFEDENKTPPERKTECEIICRFNVLIFALDQALIYDLYGIHRPYNAFHHVAPLSLWAQQTELQKSPGSTY
ncbi:hypothetical protein O181_035038 [Austropuccinia psidii MF-1]|uniref:Uncharacterized protein n=1 Tax=Austropuccinia psidii MF-1 TaxID=1389203 RepID=A0A9Q3H7X2_9BASI|nr:hypothetical protein [Austropuccinia psidii MF-1]